MEKIVSQMGDEMTNAEKKQFLSRYHKATLRVRMIETQIEQLETLARGGSPKLTGMPNGGGASDKMADRVAKIADLKTELEAEIAKQQEEAVAVIRAVNTVEAKTEHAILTMRYVDLKRWEDIADYLGYTESRAYQIGHDALEMVKIDGTV